MPLIVAEDFPDLPPVYAEWTAKVIGLIRYIASNYRRTPGWPTYLEDVELEAIADVSGWLNVWLETGILAPKYTPATAARFAWGHALEKIRSALSASMRTPSKWKTFDQRRAPYLGINPPSEREIWDVEVFENQISPTEAAATNERNEKLKELLGFLGELEPQYAQAVYLVVLKELKISTVEKLMGLSHTTIRSYVKKGLEILREILEEEGI